MIYIKYFNGFPFSPGGIRFCRNSLRQVGKGGSQKCVMSTNSSRSTPFKRSFGVKFLKTNFSGPCVACPALHTADTRCRDGKIAHRLSVGTLPCNGLGELLHGKPASITRGPAGGQNMVWPGCLVAKRNRRLFAQKQRSLDRQPPVPPIQVRGLNEQVFRCIAI